jgi:hypothetical protein
MVGTGFTTGVGLSFGGTVAAAGGLVLLLTAVGVACCMGMGATLVSSGAGGVELPAPGWLVATGPGGSGAVEAPPALETVPTGAGAAGLSDAEFAGWLAAGVAIGATFCGAWTEPAAALWLGAFVVLLPVW